MKKEKFIIKARLKHGDKYDYSLVDDPPKKEIEIICPKHKNFKQRYDDHLSGHGCSKCAYEFKLESKRIKSGIKFIEKSKIIFNNRYNYDNVSYIDMNTEVSINCPIHGEFKQKPKYHVKGHGCKTCKRIFDAANTFVVKSNKVHNNKYDYRLSNYLGSKVETTIICPIHGKFEQRPNDHLSGHGCSKCSCEKNGLLKRTKRAISYINCANVVHNNKYDYSLLNYIDSKHMIEIICPMHNVFTQYPQEHLRGYGCPTCNLSKGEIEIIRIFKKYSINYISQKKFNGCVDKRKLIFDFYLPDMNICIEYDGKQHFEPIEFFGGENGLKLTQIRDEIKNKFCKNNNILLIRIKHGENVEEVLNKFIKFYIV